MSHKAFRGLLRVKVLGSKKHEQKLLVMNVIGGLVQGTVVGVLVSNFRKAGS